MKSKIFVTSCCILIVISLVAQDNDMSNNQKTRLHSPNTAAWMSAALPGLGQGYNKKYWKIPIVWAGFATTGYFIYRNAVPMTQAKEAYLWYDQGAIGKAPNQLAIQYPSSQKLYSVYNQYRHNVELFTVISVLWYALNVIDAVVDAHLTGFNISDDIAVDIRPCFNLIEMPACPATQFTFTINF